MKMIFDIGANNGNDSLFYLKKGFRVVAVEANPHLCAELRKKFEAEILSQRLVLVEKAIVTDNSSKFVSFYINKNNSHWSSIYSSYGDRDGSAYEMKVSTTTLADLIRDHGNPYYMKVDVEGMDIEIVRALRHFQKPKYLSIEEFQGVVCLNVLRSSGYDLFKFTAQRDKRPPIAPYPSREGEYFAMRFTGEDSGCFGKELIGDWMSYQRAKEYMKNFVRNEKGDWIGGEGEWFDVHATQSLMKRWLSGFLG